MPAKQSTEPGAGVAAEIHRLPPELVFRSIRSRNLFEETVARLGQAIKLGVIPPGERFPTERELAEQLEVSRVTVREALRALEQAGFIDIRRGRHGGAYVLHSDLKQSKVEARKLARRMGDELSDIIDFRYAIEPTIAELAAKRRNDEQLARAGELLEESTRVPVSGFRAADSRFHLALAPMAHSPTLAAAAADAQLRIGELLATMPALDESIRNSHEQHRKIFEDIRAGDAEGARVTMIEHLEGTAVLLHSLA